MEEVVFKGKIIEVVQKKDEATGKVFEFARRSPGVRLIIVDQSGDKVLVTKEHRHEVGGWDYRLPGGKVFDTLEEYDSFLLSGDEVLGVAEKAAIKEAKEEAGVVVQEIKYLGTSHCGATIVWDLFYFLVSRFEKGEQSLELGENIEIVQVDLEEARAMCLDGRISEDRSAMMLLKYLNQ